MYLLTLEVYFAVSGLGVKIDAMSVHHLVLLWMQYPGAETQEWVFIDWIHRLVILYLSVCGQR